MDGVDVAGGGGGGVVGWEGWALVAVAARVIRWNCCVLFGGLVVGWGEMAAAQSSAHHVSLGFGMVPAIPWVMAVGWHAGQ